MMVIYKQGFFRDDAQRFVKMDLKEFQEVHDAGTEKNMYWSIEDIWLFGSERFQPILKTDLWKQEWDGV